MDQKCFKYWPRNMTFPEAEAHCQAQNSSLVSLENEVEEVFLKNLVQRELASSHVWVWIGLTRTGSSSPFAWTDGTPFNYSNWLVSEEIFTLSARSSYFCASVRLAPSRTNLV